MHKIDNSFSWRRNLVVVALTQFLSMAGFLFVIPFAPFYIQELGISDDAAVKYWASLFVAAAPLSFAIAAPLWGTLADRYGRRLMLLRANISAAFILAAMGWVHSVEGLLVLRLMQGVFTGTVPAAQTLVAATTPDDRQGTALGILNAVQLFGLMAGQMIGGYYADAYGYRAAFRVAGGLLLLAFFLVLFFVKEGPTKPHSTASARRRASAPWWQIVSAGLPLLLLMPLLSMARHFDSAILPLFVQELLGGKLEGAATITGWLGGVGGLAAMLSGILLGRMSDRSSPVNISKICLVLTAVFVLVMSTAEGLTFLFMFRIAALFCGGGVDPLLQAWLSRTTPEERRGRIFGWAVSARSVGWFAAPLLSAPLAVACGNRAVFRAAAALLLLAVPVIGWAARSMAARSSGKPESTELPDL